MAGAQENKQKHASFSKEQAWNLHTVISISFYLSKTTYIAEHSRKGRGIDSASSGRGMTSTHATGRGEHRGLGCSPLCCSGGILVVLLLSLPHLFNTFTSFPCLVSNKEEAHLRPLPLSTAEEMSPTVVLA